MSCYARGKEPPCPNPMKWEGCTGFIKERSSQMCGACSREGSRQAARQRKQAALNGQTTISHHTDGFVVHGEQAELTKKASEEVRNDEDLIRVCKIDTTVWTIERWVCNRWEMGIVPRPIGNSEDGWRRDNTEPIVTPLYQVKAWLKRKTAVISAREEIAALLEDAKRQMPHRKRPPALRIKSTDDAMLELALPDLHMGKLAWADETGHGHYDIKIAQQRFETALEALIARTSGHRFARVLFVMGNDLLNADNSQNTTTAGTPQSTDGRFQKTYVATRKMMIQAIEERLRPLATDVRVLVMPGNHDRLATWCMGDSLECWFHRDKTVKVDNRPLPRKYEQFGKVMLMFCHGDKGKKQDYPLLMATEQPEMFGSSLYREAHIGHRHESKLTEHHGVRVRTSPALCEPDEWHSGMGFVGNARAAEAFVWHREQGLIATAHYTVDAREEAAS